MSLRALLPVRERLELHSPYPPEECARRISEAIDAERWLFFSWSSFTGKHPVVGWVTASTIRFRKRITYNNGYQTYLTATLQPRDTGTVVEGELGLSSFARFFLPIWCGFLLVFMGLTYPIALFFLFTGHSTPEYHRNSWPFLLTPLGMLLFGYLLFRFGRYLARDEARFLTDFLRQTLDAHQPPP